MNTYTLTAKESAALDSGDARRLDGLRDTLRQRFTCLAKPYHVEVCHPDGWVWTVMEGSEG